MLFVLVLCCFPFSFISLLWRALEHRTTGERSLFTEAAQNCSASAPLRIWLFFILIMLFASVAGRHTTFKGVYLKNPLSPERNSFMGNCETSRYVCVCVCLGSVGVVVIAFPITLGKSELASINWGYLYAS